MEELKMSATTNSPNNSNPEFFVNTKGRNFYGRGSEGSEKALSTNYLNDNIKIGIHNPLPANKQDKSKYDYAAGTFIYLVPKTAFALSKILKIGIAAIEDGRKMRKAISSGANLIEVSTGGRFKTEEGVLTITIYGKLNDEKKPEIYDVFQFNSEVIINDYNVTETGVLYDLESMHIDAFYLIEQLSDFAVSMSNGNVHAHKKENKWLLDRFALRQLEIAKKLGIEGDITKSGGGGSKSVSWGNQSSSKDSGGSVETVSSSSDLANAIAAISG
jgi:hypothetical protein